MRRRALLLASAALSAPLMFGAFGARASMPVVLFSKPVTFADGSAQAVMTGTIGVHQAHRWIVAGRPGRRVMIGLKAKSATFDVCYDKRGGSKHSWQKYPGTSSDLSSWTGVLPESGRIMIEVFGGADRERYELHVKRG